jgi:hypothetical protein
VVHDCDSIEVFCSNPSLILRKEYQGASGACLAALLEGDLVRVCTGVEKEFAAAACSGGVGLFYNAASRLGARVFDDESATVSPWVGRQVEGVVAGCTFQEVQEAARVEIQRNRGQIGAVVRKASSTLAIPLLQFANGAGFVHVLFPDADDEETDGWEEWRRQKGVVGGKWLESSDIEDDDEEEIGAKNKFVRLKRKLLQKVKNILPAGSCELLLKREMVAGEIVVGDVCLVGRNQSKYKARSTVPFTFPRGEGEGAFEMIGSAITALDRHVVFCISVHGVKGVLLAKRVVARARGCKSRRVMLVWDDDDGEDEDRESTQIAAILHIGISVERERRDGRKFIPVIEGGCPEELLEEEDAMVEQYALHGRGKWGGWTVVRRKKSLMMYLQ